MEKIISTLVNDAWRNINGVIDNLRTMIRSEVKEKGKFIIPKDDEMLSPIICYESNAYSCVESIQWSDIHNDVIIYCEDGGAMVK